MGISEEESEQNIEIAYPIDGDVKNYMNKRIIKYDNDIMGQRHGGKVDLSYGINNYSRDNEIKIII